MITVAEINNEWLKLNDELGIVMSQLVEAKRKEKELLDKMNSLSSKLTLAGHDTPASWEVMT